MRVAPHNFLGVGVPWGATPTAAIVQSATPDPSYPLAALYDEQTSPLCKWSSLGANYWFNVALNIIPDGDAEQTAVPADWVVAGGTFSPVTGGVGPYKGSKFFVLDATGLGAATAYCDVLVQAGTYWKFSAAIAGNTARSACVRVIDLERGGTYYLASDGTWTTVATYVGSTSAAAWTLATVNEFRVPTFAEWGRRSGYLRVILSSPAHASDSGSVAFDEVLLYPSKLDLLAVAGHNFPARTRVTVTTWADYWHGGGGAYVWDDSTGRMVQPTGWIYSSVAPITTPYLQVCFTIPNNGSAYRLPQIGELFLGRTVAFPRSVRAGYRTEWKEDQVRLLTRGGLCATRDLQYPVRKLPITMALEGDATDDWPGIRDEIMMATGMGVQPCVLLPAYDVEPDLCFFGNFSDSLGLTRPLPHRDLDWEFVELPVPLIG